MLKHIFPFYIILKLLYKELSNVKGFIFLFSTILILSSLMLLKNYQVFFENYYISYLKSIYPHNFTEMRAIKKIKLKKIKYVDEIYEISLKDIKLFLHKQKKYEKVNIKSLGVRSFASSHIPNIIKNIYQKDTIFISDKLHKKIISNKDFVSKISFNSPEYKFKIKAFKTHLENDYILMDNNVAKKLFPLSRFNIVNIYSNYDKAYIHNLFQKKNIKIINWQDRLPFFNKLFFAIYQKISFIYVIVFSSLIIVFMVFFLSSLLDDIKKALKQILYLGNSFFYGFLIVFFVVFVFNFFIFYFSYLSFYYLNNVIMTYIIKQVAQNSIINLNSEIIYSILLMFIFSFTYTLFYKFKKPT